MKRGRDKPERQVQKEHASLNTQPTQFVSLGGVVDVDVLQELGAEGGVGSLGARQDLQHVAVI